MALRFPFFMLILVLAGTLSASRAHAQEGSDKPSEISIFTGSLLPNQIPGVTEILPVFGGRYGIGLAGGILEASLANSHAEGVDFTTISASYRVDLPAVDSFSGMIYGGLDFHYYIPNGATERQNDTGIHAGAGIKMEFAPTFALRTDLKFNAGPGTALSLLIGFVFIPGAGSSQ